MHPRHDRREIRGRGDPEQGHLQQGQAANDEVAYLGRNVVERAFCRVKDWRRINTGYDRLGRDLASTIAIATITTWRR